TLDEVLGLLFLLDRLHGFFFVADGCSRRAEIARDLGGEIGVERLIDGDEDAAIHQLLHDKRGLYVELFAKLLDGDAFGDGDLAIDRRRTLVYLAARLRAQVLFDFSALARLWSSGAAIAGTPARWLDGGRRKSGFETAARGRMLRSRSTWTRRWNTRTYPRFGDHRLAWADRSAINRLAGCGSTWRARNAGTRLLRHRGARRGKLGNEIGARRHHG